ncbi:MAG: helix-turn-helix domain-containing protein [Actinomycetota bacterium]
MEALMTPDELGDVLQIPTKTLAEWRSNGTGPAYRRVGRHVRYSAEDVAIWLKGRYGPPRTKASA